jgi:hypothetical protein
MDPPQLDVREIVGIQMTRVAGMKLYLRNR